MGARTWIPAAAILTVAAAAAASWRPPPIDQVWVLEVSLGVPPPRDLVSESPEGDSLGDDWGGPYDCGFSTIPILVESPVGRVDRLLVRLGLGAAQPADCYRPTGRIAAGPTGRWHEYARLVQTWHHSVDGHPPEVVELLAGGRLAFRPGASWRRDGAELRLTWPAPDQRGGFWIDACKVAEDGGSYDGRNQVGSRIHGERTDGWSRSFP